MKLVVFLIFTPSIFLQTIVYKKVKIKEKQKVRNFMKERWINLINEIDDFYKTLDKKEIEKQK